MKPQLKLASLLIALTAIIYSCSAQQTNDYPPFPAGQVTPGDRELPKVVVGTKYDQEIFLTASEIN